MTMWTSKLGKKFLKEEVESLDAEHHRVLQRLRKHPDNAHCAECGAGDTCWASVNLGVFLCVRCSDVHRAVGTHITKVKGCSGTYLWGPDEIEMMQSMGNKKASSAYPHTPPEETASKDERVRLCTRRYQQGPKVLVPTSSQNSSARSPIELDHKRTKKESCSVTASRAKPFESSVAKPATGINLDSFFQDFEESELQPARNIISADLVSEAKKTIENATNMLMESDIISAGKPGNDIDFDAFFSSFPDNSPPAKKNVTSAPEQHDDFALFIDQCMTSKAPVSSGIDHVPVPPRLDRDDSTKLWADFGQW